MATDTKARERTAIHYDELKAVAELPPMTRSGGGNRSSVLEKQLAKVVENTALHGKWVPIASYVTAGAASTSSATLRNRHGDVYVEGWQFATRKVDEGTRTGLFVCYEPGKVEQGGRKRFEKVQAEAKAKRAAAKAAKNGEKAS